MYYRRRLCGVGEQSYLIDGRNVYDFDEMSRLGFVYWGMGRGKPDLMHVDVAEG
jgi:hypothetical protein